MFQFIIKEKNIEYRLDTANEVANAFFENTNEWMVASNVGEVCNKAKTGDVFEYEEGIIIKCL